MKALLLGASLAALQAFFPLIVNPVLGVAPPPATSYANPGGTGDRSAFWTVTTNIVPGSGAVDKLVNGNTTADLSNGFKFNSASERLLWFKVTAADGFAYIIDAFKWYADASNDHDDWLVAGTNNDLDYVEMGTVTLAGGANVGSPVEFTWTNSNKAFKSYIVWQKPGSLPSTTPWNVEIEFKISTAYTAYASPTNVPSYANKWGFLDRSALITITTTSATGGGTLSNLVDGVGTDDASGSWWFGGGESGRVMKFDMGSGQAARVTEAQMWQDGNTNCGTWQAAWSDDDSAYTDYGTPQTWGGAGSPFVATMSFGDPGGAHRYLRLTQTSGTTSSSPFQREILLKASRA